MESQRTKNSLLFVIAVCLVLIVLKLYSGDLVREASAEPKSAAYMYGCVDRDPTDVCKKWVPLSVSKLGSLR